MLKKSSRLIFIALTAVFLAGLFFVTPNQAHAASIAENVKGRILLQVEQKGEAWYVNPDTLLRHYMGRPKDAFELMRSQGLGITNADIAKIPIGLQPLSGTDTDGDGLSDIFEDAIGSDKSKADTDNDGFTDYTEVENGFNPTGTGSPAIDNSLINRLKGKILLQVQQKGEAWYVSPVDAKRYFLGRPADAFTIMRNLGLGITDGDLSQVGIGVDTSDWQIYNNQTLGILLKYPPNWREPVETLLGPGTQIDFDEGFGFQPARLYDNSLGRNITVDERVARIKASSDYKDSKEENIVIGGIDAIKISYTILKGSSGEAIPVVDQRVSEIFFYNNWFESIYYQADKSKYSSILLDQILSTFEFIDDTSVWLTYQNEIYGFEISYPSNWRRVDFETGIGVGPQELTNDSLWGLFHYDVSQTSIEDIIASHGRQFDDRNESREQINFNGIKALKVIVTTSEVQDWYLVSILFERDGRIYDIGNGAVKDDSFESFYRSFKLIDNPSLTPTMLKNTAYEALNIELSNGIYYATDSNGNLRGDDYFYQLEEDKTAFGELNSDDNDDAAVIIKSRFGGTGTFRDLAVLLNQDGQPDNIAAVSLGDRVVVHSLDIKVGQIIVDITTHGPDDPLCCPTLRETRKYILEDSDLVKI